MKVAKALKTIANNEQGTYTLDEIAEAVDVDRCFLFDDETKDTSGSIVGAGTGHGLLNEGEPYIYARGTTPAQTVQHFSASGEPRGGWEGQFRPTYFGLFSVEHESKIRCLHCERQ